MSLIHLWMIYNRYLLFKLKITIGTKNRTIKLIKYNKKIVNKNK